MAKRTATPSATPEAQTTQYSRLPAQGVPGWITLDEALERLRAMHGVALSREAVQRAALRYRHRMEGRTKDSEPPNPEVAQAEDPAPRHNELRAARVGEGHRSYTLVEDTDANLRNFHFRKPGDKGPGRKAGVVYAKREPRATTRVGRATQARKRAASRPRTKAG